MFLAMAQPVEELIGAEPRGVTICLAVGRQLVGRSGKQQPIQRRLAGGSGRRQRAFVLDRQRLLGLRGPTAV